MPVDARRLVVLVGWTLLLLVTVLGLGSSGAGALAAPPLTEPEQWQTWLDQRDPASAAIALLRVVVLAVAWYLLLATALVFVVRLLRIGRMATTIDALTIPAIRHLVHGALGLSLATGAVVAGPTARAPLSASLAAVADADFARDEPPMVMLRLPDDVGIDADAPNPGASSAAWTTRPGDHLWSISRAVLSSAWGRTPSDDEVAPFWKSVVDANRDRLADRDNPDLIFPGQELDVPTPPPAP